jgi:hypothetical protein
VTEHSGLHQIQTVPTCVEVVTRSGAWILIEKLCVPVTHNEYHTRLRSAQLGDLLVPCVKLVRFAFAGPEAWNNLPTILEDCNITFEAFKRRLKTHLFL